MLDSIIDSLNSSLFFIGIMMLLLNVGSRYIVHELADNDEEYRKYILIRRLAVFAVCFVGTRNIVVSLILTAAFVVLSTGLFQGKSIFAREGMANQDIANRAVAVQAATLPSF
jgi:hypothetical protein